MSIYNNFLLEIEILTNGSFHITASFGGIRHSDLIPTFDQHITEKELREAQSWLSRGYFDESYAKIFGQKVFNTVFTDEIKRFFWEAYSTITEQVVFRLLIGYPMPQPFSDIPWELLYTSEGNLGFIARSARICMARYYKELPLQKLQFSEKSLNILLISSEPAGYPPISDEKELTAVLEPLLKTTSHIELLKYIGRNITRISTLRELLQRIQNRQRFTVIEKQKTTRSDLERILDQAEAEGRPFHVIHFMGHGKTDGLLLEPDPDKGDDGWIPAENFAETVARKKTIMVTLSACESAPGVNFLESTSRELLAKGVPVVIGMQVPILDRVTVEFFREFYSAWAGGQIPEKAVATARRLTPTKRPATEGDWVIPTIYVGTEEEVIVRPEAKVPPAIRLPIWILRTGWKWVLGLVTVLTVVGTLLSSRDLINQVRMTIEPLRCNYPVKMDGDFNVAISPFIVVDEQGRMVDNKLGKDIAEDIYTYIEPSIKNDLSTKDNLLIRFRGPKQTCTTTTDTAESIAKDMNANILIYGVIHTGNGLPKLDYEFEVSTLGYGQNPEITGEYAFGSQFPFYENVPILANSEITQQSIILTTIIKGLFFYSLGQYGEALVHFDEVSENPHLSEGKKIAYLLRGNAQQLLSSCNMDPGYLSSAYDSYQLSLDEDPDYLRGLIGLGGTEYLQSFENTDALPGGCPAPGSYAGLIDEVKLAEALATYESARQIAEEETDSSTQNGVEAKIYMGLGTIYLTNYFVSGEDNWLTEAQDAYSHAIEIGKNDEVAKFHVGQAYAMLATMNHCEEKIDQAIPQYEEAARRLSPAESAGYYATLGELYCWKNNLEAAVQAYENAVANCGIASREECSVSLNECDEYNSTWRKLRLQLENGNDSCER